MAYIVSHVKPKKEPCTLKSNARSLIIDEVNIVCQINKVKPIQSRRINT
jgi:hypothetical protein